MEYVVDTLQAIDECASLVQIRAPEGQAPALLQAARRIRCNIRRTDVVILVEHMCAVGLPTTPLQGAQVVARRISTLLADIDCEIQAFYGQSALALWQRLQSLHALVVSTEEPEIERPYASAAMKQEQIDSPAQFMPYLAFLANYPSRRLLHLFPYELACRYQCIPVGIERDMLTIGTSQRLDESVIAHIQEVTRRGIFQVRCEISMIDDILHYWRSAQETPPGLM